MNLLQATVDIRGNLEAGSTPMVFDLGQVIAGFASTALILSATACFAFLVYGGVKWTMAGSEKGKVDEARQTISNAIIGLAITAVSFALFSVIQYLFGVDLVRF